MQFKLWQMLAFVVTIAIGFAIWLSSPCWLSWLAAVLVSTGLFVCLLVIYLLGLPQQLRGSTLLSDGSRSYDGTHWLDYLHFWLLGSGFVFIGCFVWLTTVREGQAFPRDWWWAFVPAIGLLIGYVPAWKKRTETTIVHNQRPGILLSRTALFGSLGIASICITLAVLGERWSQRPEPCHLQLGESLFVGTGDGFGPSLNFYNTPWGPYQGSIIGLVDETAPTKEAFGYWCGIYYRHFEMHEERLWSLSISLAYPFLLSMLIPSLRIRKYVFHRLRRRK